MDLVEGVPDWLGAAIAGGVVAVVGFVLKQLLEAWAEFRRRRAERFGRLVALSSLLRASGVAYAIQNEHAQRLTGMLEANHGELVRGAEGYEDTITRGYPAMTSDERELHAIIRGITIHAMKPTNTAMLAWLGEDSHFKSALRRGGVAGEMARELSALDPHLRLWLAKYEVWIPERPDHALVYMADEDAHGLGFPPRLDEVMARALEELR